MPIGRWDIFAKFIFTYWTKLEFESKIKGENQIGLSQLNPIIIQVGLLYCFWPFE